MSRRSPSDPTGAAVQSRGVAAGASTLATARPRTVARRAPNTPIPTTSAATSPAAVDPLRRVLGDHRADPRAPLAAFTLGRLLLEDLGAPLDAARAFARSRELDPDGVLSEDAMAREVEAWSRAGEGERARVLAAAYLARHPDGRRARSVRRFGGVE